MSILQRALGTLWFVALGACSIMNITSDYDPSTNYSGLSTYNWMPDPQETTGDPRIDNPFLASRIRNAVDNTLAAKGYLVSDTPDFLIGYHAAVKDKTDVQTINTSYGYGPGWGWEYGYGNRPYGWTGAPETFVYEYEEGSLILDIVDPESNELIWRGSAQAEVDRSASPEKREKKINEAVERILAQFPPQ